MLPTEDHPVSLPKRDGGVPSEALEQDEGVA